MLLFLLCTTKVLLPACHLSLSPVVKLMSNLKQTAEAGCDMWYRMHELQGLLLSPPVDNPRNVIDYGLYVRHFKVGMTLLQP